MIRRHNALHLITILLARSITTEAGSLWGWIYELIHPCHPDDHHDCPHHNHKDQSTSSSTGGGEGGEYYYDDIIIETGGGGTEDVSNDGLGGGTTSSSYVSEIGASNGMWMLILAGIGAVGMMMMGVYMMRRKRGDEEVDGPVKKRFDSFKYFLRNENVMMRNVCGCDGIEMGERESNVDFIEIDE